MLSKSVTVQQAEVWDLETEEPRALATARVPPLPGARYQRTKDAKVNLERLESSGSPQPPLCGAAEKATTMEERQKITDTDPTGPPARLTRLYLITRPDH